MTDQTSIAMYRNVRRGLLAYRRKHSTVSQWCVPQLLSLTFCSFWLAVGVLTTAFSGGQLSLAHLRRLLALDHGLQLTIPLSLREQYEWSQISRRHASTASWSI